MDSKDKELFEKFMKLLSNNMGCSVTQRIKKVKQPRGGYINPKSMETISLGDGIEELNAEENIHASLIGLAVDYMTRYMSGATAQEAFKISLIGAGLIKKENDAKILLRMIKGLDDASITAAIKLSGFDVCYRAGIMGYKPIEEINPDKVTIDNVHIMVNRSLLFLGTYGPKVLDGFTFEGGYTKTVSTGDGDFTTSDTLWDFKVSKLAPKKEHTLQLLMYWRMGLHSVHKEFESIRFLGIYNPRLNTVYRISVSSISTETIDEIEKDVIGY